MSSLQKELTKIFKNILGTVKCWIVPSKVLRLAILNSAYPDGAGRIFSDTTGELLPGGREVIEDSLRDRLIKLNIAGKIAEKISPTVVDQAEGERTKKREAEWDVRLGLLKVRIKIQIEPPAAKGD